MDDVAMRHALHRIAHMCATAPPDTRGGSPWTPLMRRIEAAARQPDAELAADVAALAGLVAALAAYAPTVEVAATMCEASGAGRTADELRDLAVGLRLGG